MDSKAVIIIDPDAAQRKAATSLTFPAYNPLLADNAPDRLAVVALVDEAVVGLALWYRSDHDASARLLSIAVAPAFRRRGLGRRLMEASLRNIRTQRARTLWSSRLPHEGAFAALLARTGWSDRRLDQRRVSGTAESARLWAARRRMDRMLTRSGLTFTARSEMTDAEAEAVTAQIAQAGIPESWHPFKLFDNQSIVPELTLVMRWDGAIAGWLTTTELKPGLIWYYRLSRFSAATASGAMMPLIVEVNRRHYERDGPTGRWRWNTGSDQPDMLAFLDRHSASFCDFDDHYWISEVAPDASD